MTRASTIQGRGRGLSVVNPATGKEIRTVAAHGADDVENRLAAATQAFRSWRNTTFNERAGRLRTMATTLRHEARGLARLMAEEMGKPFSDGLKEAEKCAWVCEYYADHAQGFLQPTPVETDDSKSLVRFDPIGPVLAVMPWNFPFWQVYRFAAPALMAGNVALLKHASNVPGCATRIEELFSDADFPAGVFQTLLIASDEVERVIADDRVSAVTLTGSERAGMAVAEQAGRHLKKTVLELGGSDAFIVLADADVERAAATAAKARCINSGQSCIAAKRFIVDARIHDEFVRRLVGNMKALRLGDPMDEATEIGPQARRELLEDLGRQVQGSVAKGATIATGGEALDGPGYFYPPTVLTGVKPGMPAYDEEVFGPVAAVIRVEGDEEALRVANDSKYGLGASVWSRDLRKAERLARDIQAGCVFVNGLVKSDPRLPFGGVKRSGYGRELGVFGIREFTNIKTLVVEG